MDQELGQVNSVVGNGFDRYGRASFGKSPIARRDDMMSGPFSNTNHSISTNYVIVIKPGPLLFNNASEVYAQ